jgi:hypothetical protein
MKGLITIVGIGALMASSVSGCEESWSVDLAGRSAKVEKFVSLPFIESDYSKRFKFDTSENTKLRILRQRYGLDKVIASGKDEFEKQILLMDWVHHRFKKFGRPSKDSRGALEVLAALDEGHSFFCTQYAQVMISSAASLGWVDRALALRRHQGVNQKGGSTEHTTTEIWSNQFRKWIMLDPTSNMYLEKDGIPLNAWEIRQEWFYNEGKELVIVVGKDRKRYRKGDLPVHLATFQGFGDLTIEPDEIDKYGFIGYIPNTDIMDSGYDYGKMFIVHDKVCEGTKWHTRDLPANPASDPYFPIGQSTLSLTNEGGKLIVSSKTMTPNFKRFESRSDGGDWKPTGDRFEWKLKDGENHLEVRTVNAFGVIGPVSSVDIHFNK